MKLRSRRWLFSYVTGALLLLSIPLYQLDNNKLYHTIQEQMAQVGIKLQAQKISLSMMYLGSISLENVTLQADTFHAHTHRLFIDLDLAALLTGTALPQALYLQLADVNIHQSTEHNWLKLLKTEKFKLKRIDFSQSNLHFLNLDLTDVSLDIRDIGNNKNPRLELRAHLGKGRIDAHGYLRLKRGEITHGFARLQVHNAPLSWLDHQTNLDTFNATITTHIHQDSSWQSFAQIALQSKQQNKLEIRGKLDGNAQQRLNIENMILNIEDSGSLIVSGHCQPIDRCQVKLNSQHIDIYPLLSLLNKVDKIAPQLQHTAIDNLQLTTTWNHGTSDSSGRFSWQAMDYNINSQQHNTEILDAGTLIFSGLHSNQRGEWQLQRATITEQHKQSTLTLQKASYANKHWLLPLQLMDTNLWLPLSRFAAYTWKLPHSIEGQGPISGALTLQLSHNKISAAEFDIDASHAQIHWHDTFKPKDITLKLQGRAQAQQGHLLLQLADSTAIINYQQDQWALQQIHLDFTQLQKSGVRLAKKLQHLQGSIGGQVNISGQDMSIQAADIELLNFGQYPHRFTGDLHKQHGTWRTKHLLWKSSDYNTHITSVGQHINITAERLNMHDLALLQNIPFALEGTLSSKNLDLPFGTLKNITTSYKIHDQTIDFQKFQSTFYEGSMRAKHLSISYLNKHKQTFNVPQNQPINIAGDIQLGGLNLKQWKWLQKSVFQSNLKGKLYATLNLSLNINEAQHITRWKGDGELLVYNGEWRLNNTPLKADTIQFTLHKHHDLMAHFNIQRGKASAQGKIYINPHKQVIGELQWQSQPAHKLSHTWPHLLYQQQASVLPPE